MKIPLSGTHNLLRYSNAFGNSRTFHLRTSSTDRHCEQMFTQHQRDNTGRYVLRLPSKPDAARTSGTSEASALATLHNLHHPMDRQPEFIEEYRLFMNTYGR
ncbi:hypothetical protein TKK_0002970 [Trichogramma kaykai]